MTTSARCALFAVLLGLLSVAECFGTHVVGGEISYQPDSTSNNPFAYLFTLKLYRDVAGIDQPEASLYFGVGAAMQTVPVGSRSKLGVLVEGDIEMLVYTFKYIYPGPGTYTVSFTEENRNAEIVNMIQSVNTPFHIESTFTLTAKGNSLPRLLNPPIFYAAVGQKVCINPAAYDAEGGSLSYRLAVPLAQSARPVMGYSSPDYVKPLGASTDGGEPNFTINAVTGDLCWDAPGARKRGGASSAIRVTLPNTRWRSLWMNGAVA
jgi:hypothetical protein